MSTRPDHSEGATSAYRAYEIGDEDRVLRSTTIFADTDQDALIQVQSMMTDRHGYELWDRSRLIVRLPGREA